MIGKIGIMALSGIVAMTTLVTPVFAGEASNNAQMSQMESNEITESLERDSEFVHFTTNYAWTALAGLNGGNKKNRYTKAEESTLLESILLFPDTTGLTEYFPDAVVKKSADVPMKTNWWYAVKEDALRKYAQLYFNVSDQAFEKFQQTKRTDQWYDGDLIGAGAAGWGTFHITICGIKDAVYEDNLYYIDLYGFNNWDFASGKRELVKNAGWGTPFNELPQEYVYIYRAVMEKKSMDGRDIWCLHSLTQEPYNNSGWKLIDGNWYYYGQSGKPVTGWQAINGTWYYFYPSGEMAIGWVNDGGTWYYMNGSGTMTSGWQQIGGVWYFFKPSGAMAANEWYSGYWLNANGSWTYGAIGSWHQDANGWWFGDTSGWYAMNGVVRINGVDYRFNAAGYWV